MWLTNCILWHLMLSPFTLVFFETIFDNGIHAQEWSHDGSDYSSLDGTNAGIRHVLGNYWPVGKQVWKGADRLALSEADLGEGHPPHKMDHLQSVHTSKPFYRSIFSDPTLLITSTVPPLLLTVLTFPLTLTLLFHIVRQLVVIQNAFSQSLSSPGSNNPRTSSDNNNAVTKAESNFEKALDKFKTHKE